MAWSKDRKKDRLFQSNQLDLCFSLSLRCIVPRRDFHEARLWENKTKVHRLRSWRSLVMCLQRGTSTLPSRSEFQLNGEKRKWPVESLEQWSNCPGSICLRLDLTLSISTRQTATGLPRTTRPLHRTSSQTSSTSLIDIASAGWLPCYDLKQQ